MNLAVQSRFQLRYVFRTQPLAPACHLVTAALARSLSQQLTRPVGPENADKARYNGDNENRCSKRGLWSPPDSGNAGLNYSGTVCNLGGYSMLRGKGKIAS